MIVGQGKGITVSVVALFGVVLLALVAVLTVFGIREGREFQQAADGGGPVSQGRSIPSRSASAARGDPAQWITSDDYPASALRDGQQGTVTVRGNIDSTGTVTHCTITHTSGVDSLDKATCHAILARGRFAPARDGDGNAISSFFTRRVVWRIPE